MANYINADELFTKLDTIRNPNSEFATDDYIDGFSDGVSAAMKEFETMSNEDVVEIVRCKDCKYANYWFGNLLFKEAAYLCDFFIEGERVKVFANDFCSRGERKDDKK